MLNALQKRMKRDALFAALISSTPACTHGWLAMIPMVRPAILAKPTTIFPAYPDCTSRKSPKSTTRAITSRTS